jgi:hypothetical protein
MRFIAFLILGLVLAPSLVLAGPIYVYKEPDGVIRFSSKPPRQGLSAEVFTGRGARYSIMGGRLSGGWLFRSRYHELIEHAARTHAVDIALVKAIIHVESGFDPYAVSPKGAMGLMQLMPETARRHGVKRPFEPAENINGGTAHIAMLLKKYNGNLSFALAAYNAGEEAVAEYGGPPPYSETQQYLRRVLQMKSRYGLVTRG